MHLVYVRIPSKGIALHRLLWGGDDDTSEIGIGNVDRIRSGMKIDSGRGNGY